MPGKFSVHFQQMHDAVAGMIGQDAFDAGYPELLDLGESAGSSEGVPAPLAVFEAMIAKIARKQESMDMHLLNASKRDLHNLPYIPENIYLGNGGANDKRLMDAVADSFGKDFINANYLGHLSTRFHYLYVATPKVGFTKIKKMLFEAEQGRPVVDRILHDPAFSPLLEPIDDIDLVAKALASPDWFRFAFVRNPFTRLVSCYVQKIQRSSDQRPRLLPVLGLPADAPTPSFAEFVRRVADQDDAVRDIHWASQHHLLRPDLVKYDFVGRMERMAEDLAHVCERLSITPLQPLDLKINRVGGIETVASHYDDALQRLVVSTFARDFEAFGYDPERLP